MPHTTNRLCYLDSLCHSYHRSASKPVSCQDCNLVSRMCVQRELQSDHFVVKCVVNLRRPVPSVKRVISRSIRTIDPQKICNDVNSSLDSLSSDANLRDYNWQN